MMLACDMATTPQQTVQGILDELVSAGKENGVQAVVYVDGKLVADAFAGTTRTGSSEPVDGDTLFPVFSTTKGIAATVVHRLVERGLLEYDTPIAHYWPEFAAHGKESITLRHALNHTAGLPLMPRGVTHEDVCDWQRMCALMADERPLRPPGEEMVYHAITYSWLVCEPACRVTGRSFQELIHEEICVPLGMDGLFAGIPDEVAGKVADLDALPDPNAKPLVDDGTPQAVPPLVQPLHEWMNRADARRACIPASNGIMNARSIARHYAALLPGGVDGVELLSPTQVRLATEVHWPTHPRLEEPNLCWRLGYQNASGGFPQGFGHGGFGGSAGFADPEHRLALGFTRNLFGHPEPVQRIANAVLDALK